MRSLRMEIMGGGIDLIGRTTLEICCFWSCLCSVFGSCLIWSLFGFLQLRFVLFLKHSMFRSAMSIMKVGRFGRL
jgi:hypothetical protein